MRFEGRAHVFGRDVDTDAIIAAQYLNSSDPEELASHCMESIRPGFSAKVMAGDIIVAGENFGCGSSREHAPLAIKTAGIDAVVAKSFARIFYRNAINIGLPILECPEAVDAIEEGDLVAIDADRGTVENITRATSHQAEPFPEFLKEIIDAGGLLERTRRSLEGTR